MGFICKNSDRQAVIRQFRSFLTGTELFLPASGSLFIEEPDFGSKIQNEGRNKRMKTTAKAAAYFLTLCIASQNVFGSTAFAANDMAMSLTVAEGPENENPSDSDSAESSPSDGEDSRNESSSSSEKEENADGNTEGDESQDQEMPSENETEPEEEPSSGQEDNPVEVPPASGEDHPEETDPGNPGADGDDGRPDGEEETDELLPPETEEEPEGESADDSEGELTDAEEPADESSEKAPLEEAPDEEPVTGALQVEIQSLLGLSEEPVFTLVLSGKQSGDEGESFFYGPEFLSLEPFSYASASETGAGSMAGNQGFYTFYDLPQGRYELTVSARGYERFTQTVTVKDSMAKVTLLDQYQQGSEEERHPGIIRLGDLNGDGTINREDRELILQALPDGDEEGDLNGDGTTDLLDLHYFTLFYENSRVSSSVEYLSLIRAEELELEGIDSSDLELLMKGAVGTSVAVRASGEGEVSAANPIVMSMEAREGQAMNINGMVIQQPAEASNRIDGGEIIVEIDGEESSRTVTIAKAGLRSRLRARSGGITAVQENDGTIVLDLGGKKAVKKVTIRITKTVAAEEGGSLNLAEISKVEFFDDMSSRIPEPQVSTPVIDRNAIVEENKSFTVYWNRIPNVTGYQLEIEQGGKKEILGPFTETSRTVDRFQNEKLKNGTPYMVRVRSVSGSSWSSEWSSSVTATPRVDELPAPPEGISITPGYKKLSVSWKNMEDTDSYTVYYRIKSEDPAAAYESVEVLAGTSCTLTDLEDRTEYEIYLTGTNELGTGAPSEIYVSATRTLDPPVTPNYKLINWPVDGQVKTEKIQSVLNMNMNEELTPDMVDGDYSTAWVVGDWDTGVNYPNFSGYGKSPVVVFTEPVYLDTIVIVPDDDQTSSYTGQSVYAWEEDGGAFRKIEGRFRKVSSENGKSYYEFQANEPFTAKRIQVNLTTGWARRISIAELKFYEYDDLEARIGGLYQDDMHLQLKPETDEGSILELREQLLIPDDRSGELHPHKEYLTLELDNAERLLNDQDPHKIMTVNHHVTRAADSHISFLSGLNAWQPLGISAGSGDQLVIYVGSPGKKTGDSTNLKLVYSQYHADPYNWYQDGIPLTVGANIVDLGKITDMKEEAGGSLYIEYTGAKGAETYGVRVLGGNEIPVLDLTKASSEEERLALAKDYVEELKKAVADMEEQHQQLHSEHSFEPENCILNATDIVMDNMMLSLASSQVLNGLGGKGTDTDEAAEKLVNSARAMEDMVLLFYQHKGLTDAEGTAGKNLLPSSRLNIRYKRQFDGAFMHAGGKSIGIEWDSLPPMVQGSPVEIDENGKRTGKDTYFGWGIAHEIGHEINEGLYAVAEVTNNYFSILSQADDTRNSVRFSYENVYDKVTSGVQGAAADVFTQLGMYWQFHLAYDRNGYNYKLYDNYEDLFSSLVFARIDTYIRGDLSRLPEAGAGLDLSSGDKDNKLMRLACAAANRNVLEFFRRWGMKPDSVTEAYAARFEKEERAIWLVNDEARAYAMENSQTPSRALGVNVNAEIQYTPGRNQVTLTLSNDAGDDSMLGYEIFRTNTVEGKEQKVPVGFVEITDGNGTVTFTDTIETINNRVFTYSAVGYDKFLYPTEETVLEPVKVSHDGGVAPKSGWTVTTNMVSSEDAATGNEDMPCEPAKEAINKVIDNQSGTVYTGKASGADPQITISLNSNELLTGFRYESGSEQTGDFRLEISMTGESGSWTELHLQHTDETGKVYFIDEQNGLETVEAAYVRFTAVGKKGKEISVAELSLLGQTGDNVEFSRTGAVGILEENYTAGTIGGEMVEIPAGSLIFTGAYKGSPAYNTVLLYDGTGTIVTGEEKETGDAVASQVIFAPAPEGDLLDTSEGFWVYYLEPGTWEDRDLPEKVRAELYRVDDALTNEGARMVSDTLWLSVPDRESLQKISLQTEEEGMNR